MTLTPPTTPVAGGDAAPFAAAVALDCQTALSWTAASSGGTSIPVTLQTGSTQTTVVISGATTVQLDTHPCAAAGATQTTSTTQLVLTTSAATPALTDIAAWVHASMPESGPAGQTVVAADDVNKSVAIQVKPVLVVQGQPEQSAYSVTGAAADFNVTFENLGNVPFDLRINNTSEAVIQAPKIHLGVAADPTTGPSRQTGVFRFQSPGGAWTKVVLELVVTPQVQLPGGGVLTGSPATIHVQFDNHAPAKKSPSATAPLVGVLLLAMAMVARAGKRRRHP